MADEDSNVNNPSEQEAGGGASLEQPGGIGRAVSRQPISAAGKEFKQTLDDRGDVPLDELAANQNVYPTKPGMEESAALYAMETPTRTIEAPGEGSSTAIVPANDVPTKIYGASRDANAVTSFNETTRDLANESHGTGYTFDHPGKPVLDHIVDVRGLGGQGLPDGSRGGIAGLGHDVYTRDERRRYISNDPQEP